MQATLENLISYIIYQKPNRAQLLKYLNAVLATDKTEKSKRFISTASKKIKEETIANGQLTELPTNIRGMVTSEPAETFPENRFLETEAVRRTASEIIRILEVQKELKALNIDYTPTLLLYGASGCGKTMLARYIAKQVHLPYYYIRFSSLIDSLMGKTAKNLEMVFSYFRENPGVICIDEIDAIGIAREEKADSAGKEVNRIVITLMQEIEKNVPDSIVIATTNREDCMDAALKRRFTKIHEILPFTFDEAQQYTAKFFKGVQKTLQDCKENSEENLFKETDTLTENIIYTHGKEWLLEKLKETGHDDTKHIPAYIVSRICIESLVTELAKQKEAAVAKPPKKESEE